MRRFSKPAAWAAFATVLLAPLWAFAADSDADLFTRTARAHGWGAALPAAFLGGLMTALTPCVYPMIAITVSVFGARTQSRRRAMALSSAFVLGIAACFVPLGLLAGLTGQAAGRLAGNPVVVLFEALLMFAMALSMFGVFEITLPGSVQNRLAAIGGLGMKGAFLIGLATGPIAAPCATAILVGILDFIFKTQNAGAGAAALSLYSVGLGLPFWLVGALGAGLPKPGRWMDYVKNFMGLVLLVVGVYYLRRLVPVFKAPPRALPAAAWICAAMVVVGIAIGAVHLSLKEGSLFERARKILGLAIAVLGAVWFIGYEPPERAGGACTPLAWDRDPSAAQARARREGRPMLLDFGATWCSECEQLAHTTFREQAVACAASEMNFITVKIYDDDQRPANYEALWSQFGLHGLPTVIVLDANGHEVARTTGFIDAQRMVSLMRRADQRRSER